MAEKVAVAGEHHVGEAQVSELTSSGFAKTAEKDIKARNADFAAAVSENRPNPWGRGYLMLYCYCLILYLCSTVRTFPIPAQTLLLPDGDQSLPPSSRKVLHDP